MEAYSLESIRVNKWPLHHYIRESGRVWKVTLDLVMRMPNVGGSMYGWG